MALKELAELGDLHAIEKSTVLIQELDPSILIVGTEFAEQSLLSKQVDIIFSNPPYSDFEQWAEKIIRQAAASIVYLVLPQRWQTSGKIADALTFREAKAHNVGSFDFENSERQARAKVHLLRIELNVERHGEKNDAFERFFREQFAELLSKFDAPTSDVEDKARDDRKQQFAGLVVGAGYPEAMVSIYNAEMAKVERNYQLVSQLDVELLREFEISPDKIMSCLKARLSGLRNDYWNELFSHLGTITDRLASKSRKTLLEILQKHVHVDFTLMNIYAVIIWLIKNANQYIDKQLVEVYELMVSKCNVQMYKSNKKTFEEERWRYNGDPEKNSHFALDYRIVTHRVGGIKAGYSWDKGLDERAADFLGDLLTIARNLGFWCSSSSLLWRNSRENWQPDELQKLYFSNSDGERELLYDVRAFKNGNLHLRLNKRFILALNVEHGRLKGWLRSATEAVEELKDPEAADFFRSNVQLETGNPALMLCDAA